MKLLITGCNGQLGRELRRELERRAPGISTYVDKDELDLTDRKAVETFLMAAVSPYSAPEAAPQPWRSRWAAVSGF